MASFRSAAKKLAVPIVHQFYHKELYPEPDEDQILGGYNQQAIYEKVAANVKKLAHTFHIAPDKDANVLSYLLVCLLLT